MAGPRDIRAKHHCAQAAISGSGGGRLWRYPAQGRNQHAGDRGLRSSTSDPFQRRESVVGGEAEISTFSREELLATKLRALLQRNKGRDLLDLFQALETLEALSAARIVECFGFYVQRGGTPISRAQAEERMFAKLAAPRFLADIRPLLAADQAERLTEDAIQRAFVAVFTTLIGIMPGETWAKTADMKKRFGIA
jgi:hypothetical protein